MKQSAPGKDSKQANLARTGTQKQTAANHIVALSTNLASAPTPNSQHIPAYVTGVRRRYLEAVQAEANAKRTYEASCVLDSSARDRPRQSDAEPLLNQINALCQRQEQVNLDVLTHYINEFEALVPRRFEKYEHGEASDSAPVEMKLTKQQEHVATLTGELEKAVVEAAGQAAKEKKALQAAHVGLDVAAISTRLRQEALSAVRNELNSWIENNLAACGMDESNRDALVDEKQVQTLTSMQDVEKAYSDYLKGRMRLVSTMDDFTDPLPDLGESPKKKAERTNMVLEHDTASMAEVQYSHWQDERSLKELRSYFQTRFATEKTETAEILQRLADESQLLPSYPNLSQAGRPKNISSKDGPMKTDILGFQVDAWAFAAEAADAATTAQIDKEAHRGKEAVERATEILQDMALLHESTA